MLDLLDAAAEIGARTAAEALWEGDRCTWTIMAPVRGVPAARRQAVPERASGLVYSGSAGIALFLVRLHRLTGEEVIRETALGAIRFALDAADRLPPTSFGFHSGRVGVAFTAWSAGSQLGRQDLLDAAEALLRPMAGRESDDRGIDVIGGGAGAIPALLRMATDLDPLLCGGMARRLGLALVDGARREPVGWSWGGTGPSTSARNLCGYAHGAAGIGHALLELYAATGESGFRYAAEQAFLYERSHFSPEHDNWPDFRHKELGEYVYEQRLDELRERLARGDELAPHRPSYMSAWCHGAPGIGLSRLRAMEVLGDEVSRAEAEDAMRATIASIVPESPHLRNFSLCHGVFGNLETLRVAAAVLDRPDLLRFVKETAAEAVERHRVRGGRWPCGTVGNVPDPGLMLGEAGIAYFLLSLVDPATPSLLCLSGGSTAAGGPPPAEPLSAEMLRDRYLSDYLGGTLRMLRRAGVAPPPPPDPLPVRESVVEAMVERLELGLQRIADPRLRASVEEVLALDRARLEMERDPGFTDEYLRNLRPVPQLLSGDPVSLRRSPHVRLLESAWDWGQWLAADTSQDAPSPRPAFHLLFRRAQRIHLRTLSPFAALVVESVAGSATPGDVVACVRERVSDPPDGDPRLLETLVRRQLQELLEAGILVSQPIRIVVPNA